MTTNSPYSDDSPDGHMVNLRYMVSGITSGLTSGGYLRWLPQVVT